MSRHRNLRKPTPRRVAYWWRDYLRAWGAVGHAVYNEAWWAAKVARAEGTAVE